MKCSSCQTDNLEGAKFCKKCGNKLEITCPACGHSYEPDSIFCNECGHKLLEPAEAPPIDYSQPQSYTPRFLADKILTTRSSIEGERKLVTVLFADVANYTSISEKLDPEEVHQIMDGCFKILMDEIHKYEGTINQFTGDGVMALFGAPVAHEDHAQRACHAALSIQKAIGQYGAKVKKDTGQDFSMRIGLNSGPVIVGSIGDDLRMDYTAVGDTTNLASRMQSIAEPGTTLVSHNTHRLARDFFEFNSLGKVEVKGKEEPVSAFELLKAGEVITRIEAAAAKGLTRFVGRKNSMAALMEAYEEAKAGSGQVVGMVGEAGVGKSRLLLEFRNRLSQGEFTYLEGRCLHYGGSMAYLPFLDMLRVYFDIKEGDRQFVIKKKMEQKVLGLDENLSKAFSPFQDILSLKVDDEAYLQVEPVEKRMRTFEALRDLFIRESQIRMLVMAVEDLHWIDKTSHEFLDFLVGWLANARILLILLYRPEYTHQWGSKSYYKHIGLDQLTLKSSAELVQAILEGGEVVPELRELILNRAAGNPLFMEELTQSLLENGSIKKENHQYVLTRAAGEIPVPNTIQGIIAARIDRVEENLKRIMQVASVIGREFAFRILQTIMGMSEELKSQLFNLQGLEFISEKRLFPELEYIFKHALTQEVAYNSLLIKRRKEIHERIGDAIEDLYPDRLEEYYELLAYHYTRSANNQKALEYLDRASRKASRLNAMEDAKTFFDEFMKLLDTLPETRENQKRRISLLVNQWPMFFLLFKFAEYYDQLSRYEQMAIGLGDQDLLGIFYARMAQCEWWFAYFDQAIQRGTKAIELCEAAGNVEGVASASMAIIWCYYYKGDYDKVLAMKEDIIRLAKQQFNLRQYVYGLLAISMAHSDQGRWDDAVREGKEVLKVAEEFSDNNLVSMASFFISIAYNGKGDLVRAIEYGELAIQKATTPGDKAWAQTFLAWAWCRAGEHQRGVEILAALLPMYKAVSYGSMEVACMVFLGEGYWLTGEYDKARQTLEESVGLAERRGMKHFIGHAYLILGEVCLKTNATQAASHFEKSITILTRIKAENELALAYAGFGRFHKQQGNTAQARENLTKSLEIFERLGTLIEPDKVRKELTELSEEP